MMKNFEELQTIGKDNLDAAVASATALTSGLQTIATEMADFARTSFETGAAAFEEVLQAKSVEKAVDLQTKFAKTAYEGYVEKMGKVGELYVETAKDVYKPIEARVGEFSKTVTADAKKVA